MSHESKLPPAVKEDVRGNFKTLLRGGVYFCLICVLYGFASVIIYIHVFKHLPHETVLEWMQSAVLLLSAGLYYYAAVKLPEERGGILLIAGLLTCMLIREQDNFLNYEHLPVWETLVFIFLCALFYYCFKKRGYMEVLYGLSKFIRSGAMPAVCVGLGMVLVFSRLYGWTGLWMNYFPVHAEARLISRMCEESLELLGYIVILLSALSYCRKRLSGSW